VLLMETCWIDKEVTLGRLVSRPSGLLDIEDMGDLLFERIMIK